MTILTKGKKFPIRRAKIFLKVVVFEAIVKGHSKMNDEFLELPFQHVFHFFVLIDEILAGCKRQAPLDLHQNFDFWEASQIEHHLRLLDDLSFAHFIFLLGQVKDHRWQVIYCDETGCIWIVPCPSLYERIASLLAYTRILLLSGQQLTF